jgi:hypothetical protein
MPTQLPKDFGVMQPNGTSRLGLIAGSVIFVLFPPFLLILGAAAYLGDGRISFESLCAVFRAGGPAPF